MASKSERCRFAGCPLAGKGDPRCRNCTGPVVWTAGGRRTGVRGVTHRACTSCPMNGLGLPVCAYGCDGPNPEFSTDGQRMVSLGGMPDADAYLARSMAIEKRVGPGGREMFRPDERAVAAAVLAMDSAEWEEFSAACARRDVAAASAAAGLALGAFRGPGGGWEGSVVDRLMAAMAGLSGAEHDVVKGLAERRTQSGMARLQGGISKQAVHARIGRLGRRMDWVGRLAGMEH